jgi:hypothetical protein
MPYYTYQPSTADVRTKQNDPAANFASENPLYVKSLTDEESKAYITFDLSSAPASGAWNKCYLYLYCTSVTAFSRTMNVHRITETWAEATVTWIASPAVSATLGASQVMTAAPWSGATAWHYYEIAIAEARLMRDTNYGLRLSWATLAGGDETVAYAPRNYVTENLRPYLYVLAGNSGSPMWWS